MDEVLGIVKSSFSERADPSQPSGPNQSEKQFKFINIFPQKSRPEWEDGDVFVEDDFRDDGAGAGIEGDLEMGEEE